LIEVLISDKFESMLLPWRVMNKNIKIMVIREGKIGNFYIITVISERQNGCCAHTA